MFRIEGTPDEIQHAMQLICEKAGIVSTPVPFGHVSVNVLLCRFETLRILSGRCYDIQSFHHNDDDV